MDVIWVLTAIFSHAFHLYILTDLPVFTFASIKLFFCHVSHFHSNFVNTPSVTPLNSLHEPVRRTALLEGILGCLLYLLIIQMFMFWFYHMFFLRITFIDRLGD